MKLQGTVEHSQASLCRQTRGKVMSCASGSYTVVEATKKESQFMQEAPIYYLVLHRGSSVPIWTIVSGQRLCGVGDRKLSSRSPVNQFACVSMVGSRTAGAWRSLCNENSAAARAEIVLSGARRPRRSATTLNAVTTKE
jgi:hypothetical protein